MLIQRQRQPFFSQFAVYIAIACFASIAGFLLGTMSPWVWSNSADSLQSHATTLTAVSITRPNSKECEMQVSTVPTSSSPILEKETPPTTSVLNSDDPRIQQLLNFRPTLANRSVEKGVLSVGDTTRMRRFLDKLINGKPVTLLALGGSVTAGQGAFEEPFSYWTQFVKYVNETFPVTATDGTKRKHRFLNLAFGGSTSQIFTMCINTMARDADLVVVEFSVNDRDTDEQHLGRILHPEDPKSMPITKGYERLLRKVMKFPSRPAVILLHHYSWFASQPLGSPDINPYVIPHGPTEWDDANVHDPSKPKARYYDSTENDYTVIGSYYGLPQLSVRSGAYHLMAAGVGGFQSHVWYRDHENVTVEKDLFYYDDVHPQAKTGAKYISELLLELLHRTAADLQLRPYISNEEEALVQEPLVTPMIPHNWERLGTTCMLSDAMQPAVKESKGNWVFKDERQPKGTSPKWGWIGTEPNSWAKLLIDTRSLDQGAHSEHAIITTQLNEAVVSYLKSYEHMGKFRVECVEGCVCEAKEVNCHDPTVKVSVSDIVRLSVTQHERCILQVTILPETTSGEHKIKLTGLMLLEGGGKYDSRDFLVDILANQINQTGLVHQQYNDE